MAKCMPGRHKWLLVGHRVIGGKMVGVYKCAICGKTKIVKGE